VWLIRAAGDADPLFALLDFVCRREAPQIAEDRIDYTSQLQRDSIDWLPHNRECAGRRVGLEDNRIGRDLHHMPVKILNPLERRHDYPFANCTHEDAVSTSRRCTYDADDTTMGGFAIVRGGAARDPEIPRTPVHAQAISPCTGAGLGCWIEPCRPAQARGAGAHSRLAEALIAPWHG